MSSNTDVPFDKSKIRRLSSRINRYFDRLFEFPDNLFPGFTVEEDIEKIQEIFSKNQSTALILEFGSGSGAHLISLARLKPDAIVLGFEIRFKRSVRTVEKALQSEVTNLYVFRGRSELAPKLLGDRKAKEIYINFPDPWEKKRWRKHRILSSDNLRMIAEIINEGGTLSVKTDHQEYFDTFLEEFKNTPDLPFKIEHLTHDLQNHDCPESELKTEFEQLFRSQGKAVYYVRMVKYTG